MEAWGCRLVSAVYVLYARPRQRVGIAAPSAPGSAKWPAVPPPPALPFLVTERVLELSLEQAVQLALQNNLDMNEDALIRWWPIHR